MMRDRPQMMRVEYDDKGKPRLLLKIFPTGIEIKPKSGDPIFIDMDKDTLEKVIDNFTRCGKITLKI